MSRLYVKELANGAAVDEVFLISEKQLRSNRQGNLYLHLELRDRTGAIGARYWNATEDQARQFEPGDYLAVKGKVQLFQGALQLIVSHMTVVPPGEVEAEEFLPQGPCDIGKLMTRLRGHLMGLTNHHLRALAECFLIDEEFLARFSAAPAGVRNHHAYRGGLLEHVVTLLGIADRMTEFYPELDRDLLLMGLFLHDVGKVDELRYDHGNLSYSDEGQLVGHIILGVVLLREKLAQAVELTGEPFPDDLKWRLEHMIASHHGTHEFGSPVLPMTPEAIALHHLDNLDAKLHLFLREIREDVNRDGRWTPYQANLDRRLFKGTPGPNGRGEA